MGPIPPWIPRPAATSLNPISESTFPPISLFLFDLLQNARHLSVSGFRITSCPRWSHGCCARQWRTVVMSSQPDIFICHPPSFPFSLSQRFPFHLFWFWFHQERPFFLKSSNNTILCLCHFLLLFLINKHRAFRLSPLFHPPNPRPTYLTKETTGL